MTDTNALQDRITAALSDEPGDNIVALAIVIVEQAMNFRRQDGTIGTTTDIKAFLNQLINGITDICAEAPNFPQRRAGAIDVKLDAH